MDFRFNIVKKILEQSKSDAIILISVVNRKWYTGIWSDFGFITITKNEAHTFVDARDFGVLKAQGNTNSQLHLYTDLQSWIKFNKSLKIKTLLIESDKLTMDQYAQFIKPLGIKTIHNFKSDNLRAVKDEHELRMLQKAADIVCDGITHLKKWVKVGVSEKAVANELLQFMVNAGASGLAFDTIVSFGSNSANPHSTPTDRKLQSGELILVDAGCMYQGYCSDITRVWWIGKPTKQMLKMYSVVVESNALGIEKAKAGITGRELDAICRSYIAQQFNGYNIPHGVGHGVGMLIHEEPNNKFINDQPLPVNAVVTIEPGIYDENIGGVRIEDTVVITKTGCRVLTNRASK